MIMIGIDTGATGAVAVGSQPADLRVFDLVPEPLTIGRQPRNVASIACFVENLRRYLPPDARAVAFLEAPVLQPKNGAILAAQTGATLGGLRGALLALGVRVEIVEPQAWYAHHGLAGTSARPHRGATRAECETLKRAAKEANVARARALFPHLLAVFEPPAEVRLTKSGERHKSQPAPKPAFDRADAALIWSYAHSLLGR